MAAKRSVLTQRRKGAEVAEKVRLADVCVINMGQSPSSESYNNQCDGLPFFQGNADFGETVPTARIWCKAPTKIAERGDILISVRAPIGALNFADEKCCIGRGLAALRVNEGYDSSFVYFALKSKVDDLNLRGTGSTFKAINKNELGKTSIPLYPRSIQKRIAAVLDKICELKKNAEAQIENLDLLVKSRFVEMFGDMMTNPKRWPKVKMAEVIDCIGNGHSFVCEPFARTGDNPAILKLSAVTWGVYKPEENKALKADATYYPACEVKPGDLLFTRKNTLELVGKCAYVRETPPKLMLPDLIFRLETNERIDKLYLANLINHDGSRAAIRKLSSGSAGSMPNISKARLLGLAIPLPTLSLQREFAAFVEKVEKLKDVAKKSVEEMDTLYRAKLQEYFG